MTKIDSKRVAQIIIDALEREDYTAESFPSDAPLFGPADSGGLGFDSLAALEIACVLSDEFNDPLDDLSREDMMSVNSIVGYLLKTIGPRVGDAD